MATALAPREAAGKTRARRLIGWQGFTVRVPENWDLTGFSGTDESGYLRVDDGEEQGLEIKWATEPKKAKSPPDIEVRRESYFRALRQTAKKKRIDLETREADAPRGVVQPERTATGFTWIGDRKGIGALWYCARCRRTVIAQVLGAPSGRGGLSGVAADILASLQCHGEEEGWRTWALYDLHTEVPSDWKLAGQQLMNVYLRLNFTRGKGVSRLTVEQWSLANVARKNTYLDVWLTSNSRSEIGRARYTAEAGEIHGHALLDLSGGPKPGLPMLDVVREALRFHWPATRFRAQSWECEASNKIFSIQEMRAMRVPDVVPEIAARTHCHSLSDDEGA
jgi:hypothetical protein